MGKQVELFMQDEKKEREESEKQKRDININ
jgi:hypothetical protein